MLRDIGQMFSWLHGSWYRPVVVAILVTAATVLAAAYVSDLLLEKVINEKVAAAVLLGFSLAVILPVLVATFLREYRAPPRLVRAVWDTIALTAAYGWRGATYLLQWLTYGAVAGIVTYFALFVASEDIPFGPRLWWLTLLLVPFLFVLRMPHDPPPVARLFLPVLSIVLSTFAITFILEPHFCAYVKYLKDSMPGWLPPSVECAKQLLSNPDPSNLALPAVTNSTFWNDSYSVFGTTLAALSAASVLLATTEPLARWLESINFSLGLNDVQQMAAKRILLPAEHAARTLDRRHEILIDHQSDARRFADENAKGTRGALIKLIIDPSVSRSDRAKVFEFEKLRRLLASAKIALEKSLFFVCMRTDGDMTIIGYGTGSELEELSLLGQSSATSRFGIGAQFFDSLQQGTAGLIQNVIEEARASLLGAQPDRDVLLSTVTSRASDSLAEALNILRTHNLNRILLVSHRVPFERGILGSADIGAFLLGH